MSEAKTADVEVTAKHDYFHRVSFLLILAITSVAFRTSAIVGLLILSPIFAAQLVSSGYKHAAVGSKVWSRAFIWTGYFLACLLPTFAIIHFSESGIPNPF